MQLIEMTRTKSLPVVIVLKPVIRSSLGGGDGDGDGDGDDGDVGCVCGLSLGRVISRAPFLRYLTNYVHYLLYLIRGGDFGDKSLFSQLLYE